MIQPINFNQPNIIGFRMNGKITADEIKDWAALLEKNTHQPGKLRVYVEAEDIDGVTMNAVVQDLTFDLTHLGDFEKAAFVSDESWTKLSAFMASLVPNLEAKQFSPNQKQDARQWIQTD